MRKLSKKIAQQVEEYNKNNPGYYITNIKNTTPDQIAGAIKYGSKSLQECYKSPSDRKISSYNGIIKRYAPAQVLAVQGSCQQYTVLLRAGNGDILHVTHGNVYLVNVEDTQYCPYCEKHIMNRSTRATIKQHFNDCPEYKQLMQEAGA